MWSKIFQGCKIVGGWCKTVASERDGTGSSSRIIALLVAGITMGCMIAFFVYHKELPTANQMYAMSTLVAAGTGAYIGNSIGGGGGTNGGNGGSGGNGGQ
jgi:hypothetical protein